jgi:hypothetical protein
MRKIHAAVAVALTGWVLGAAPALAASDYLLELDGVQGEAATKGPPAAIEISSWSWGASNPTSVGAGGAGAGKVSMQDLSVTTASAGTASVKSPRDVATGQASGKRTHTPMVAGDLDGDGSADAAVAAPQPGDVTELTLRLRESPSLPSRGQTLRACVPGQHIDHVVLSGKGQRVELQDAVVTSCTSSGDGTVMKVKGKTGHVTLMK